MSLSLAHFCLEAIEPFREGHGEVYADILMTLSSTYHCLGDAANGLRYAQAHFEQRTRNEDEKGEHGNLLLRGMGYTELALAKLHNKQYDEALLLASQGLSILKQSPEFLQDDYWPHFAVYHAAWALIGLGRGKEAIPMLDEMLRWRRRKYGENQTESMK